MTMGTSIMRSSLSLIGTSHTPPRNDRFLENKLENTTVKRIGDTESRGPFRCGSCFGFYPAPLPWSNERECRPRPDWSASPELQLPCRFLRRRPEYFRYQRFSPKVDWLLLPEQPGRVVRRGGGRNPSSSYAPGSCLAQPGREARVPGE